MDSRPLMLLGLTSFIKSIAVDCEIRVAESCLWKISEALMYQAVDVLITDLQSAEENMCEGMDILLNISTQFPSLSIVAYTFCHDGYELRKLLNHNNISVISRGEQLADTEDYFKQAFAKKRVLSSQICCDIARLNKSNHHVSTKLTRCEIDVLKHLYSGMDLRQIAKMKQLSIKTISAHKCNSMRKLEVKTDLELFLLLQKTFRTNHDIHFTGY